MGPKKEIALDQLSFLPYRNNRHECSKKFLFHFCLPKQNNPRLGLVKLNPAEFY